MKWAIWDHRNKWLIEEFVPVFQEFAQMPMSLEKFFARFGVPDGI
jgi:hypothetical protein